MFCRSCSTCSCISDVFVGRKVISTSYSSAILKVSCHSPTVCPLVVTAVHRSHKPRREDERGVPMAGTGSQQGDGKDASEKPRQLKPLLQQMPLIPPGRRCQRGHVLRIAVPGAQRLPLVQWLSARMRRAGAARPTFSFVI